MSNFKQFLVNHSPEILMSIGLSGLIFSIGYTIKATKDANDNIQRRKKELNVDKLDAKEIFLCSWKPFLPVALSTAIAIPCIICGNRVSSKKNATLAAAYALSETAIHEYQSKVKEVIGEKKEKDIREAISKEQIESHPNTTQIILTNDGDSLFYEPITGRYFKSSWNKILKSANKLNSDALSDFGLIKLNDWFYELGLDSTELGDILGWEVLNGPRDLIDIELNSSLTQDDTPCGAIYYLNRPKML